MRSAPTLLAGTAVLALALAAAAPAQETVLQNDSFNSGDPAVFHDALPAGEVAAVRLTPAGPFPMQIWNLWFLLGHAGPQTIRVRVWDDSAGTVDPGALIFTGDFNPPG